MNVTSLELSKELYELSGWEDTQYSWALHGEDSFVMFKKPNAFHGYIAAYDLGYLLRKLPSKVYLPTHSGKHLSKHPSVLDLSPRHSWDDKYTFEGWRAAYLKTKNQNGYMVERADTPEDAAAKLAIELFKQGVLTRDEQ